MSTIFTDDEIYKMYEEYKNGLSLEAVCRMHYYSNAAGLADRFRKLRLEVRPKNKSKIAPEDMPRVVELRKQNMTYAEIGKLYNAHSTTVKNAFRRYGIPCIEVESAKLAAKKEARCRETLEMYELYKQGKSAVEIGLKYGVLGVTVRTRFKEFGLPVIIKPKRIYNLRFIDDEIRTMYDEYKRGTSIRELADRNNCKTETIYARFSKLGLKVLPHRKTAAIIQTDDMPRMPEMRR